MDARFTRAREYRRVHVNFFTTCFCLVRVCPGRDGVECTEIRRSGTSSSVRRFGSGVEMTKRGRPSGGV